MLKSLVPRLCAVTAVVLASTLAHAAPEEDDPLGRLLAERGLLSDGTRPTTNERVAAPSQRAPVRRVASATKPSAPNKAQALVRQTRDQAAALIAAARGLMGVPYVHGGNSADEGFDCSGLVFYSHQQLGLTVPRTSRDQADEANEVKPAKLRRGDLVFFKIGSRRVKHVGIYIGDRRFVHAPGAGKPVSVSSLDEEYYSQRFHSAGRFWDRLPD